MPRTGTGSSEARLCNTNAPLQAAAGFNPEGLAEPGDMREGHSPPLAPLWILPTVGMATQIQTFIPLRSVRHLEGLSPTEMKAVWAKIFRKE